MNRHTSLLALLLVSGAALLVAPACSRKIYIPVERVAVLRDSTRTTALRADTVMLTDSIVMERRGDTVYHTSWRLRQRVSLRVDTLVRVLHDTIVQTRTIAPTPESVPAPTLAQRFLNATSGILAWVALIAAIVLVVRIIWHRITRRNP